MPRRPGGAVRPEPRDPLSYPGRVSDPDRTARLRTLSSGLLSVPESDLTREALLADDLGVDSLAAIEWGMAIEDEFDVELPDGAWETTTSYGAVEDLLDRLVAARA